MNHIADLQAEKIKFDQAEQQMLNASQRLDDTSLKVNEDLIKTVEKFALYSAGIISLSITFLGYLIEQNKTILLTEMYKISLIGYLFLSWIFLVITLIIGLMVRFWNAFYLFYETTSDYLKWRSAYKNRLVKLSKLNYPIISSTDDKQTFIDITQKESEDLSINSTKTKKSAEKYFTITRFVCKYIILFFILGVILLTIFASVTVYRIISN